MKTGVPAGTVKGLSFPTPSQSALQAEAAHLAPPVMVATPAAHPDESIPVRSDVDWSSAFLLSVAFVLGAPVVLVVPLLLSIFAPLALLLIPLATIVFLFVGPKRYRSRLGHFWNTVRAPHKWRLSTTGAAASLAAGFYLAIFLVGSFRWAVSDKGGVTNSVANATRNISRQNSGISADPPATASADLPVQESVVSTEQVKNDLKRKSKAEVKAYFGRKPDEVSVESWTYRGNWFDFDAERTMVKAWILFSSDGRVFKVEFLER